MAEPEGESLPEQLLSLFAHVHLWRDLPSTQCQCLSLLVQLISSAEIAIKLADALSALEICTRTFESADDSTSVRPAARATLTQMLNSFVHNRLALGESESAEIGAAMDVAALLGELISKMGAAVGKRAETAGDGTFPPANGRANQPLLLPLDAIFSVLSALETPLIERHCPLLNRLKNELVPLIIWQLRGSAKYTELSGNASKRIGTQLIGTMKRAGPFLKDFCPSGVVSVAMALEGPESARSFYQVVDQLLRLLSPMPLSFPAHSAASSFELLPLLEELWRCALLSPIVEKRSEALRLVKRICVHGQRFAELIRLSVVSGKNAFWLVLLECVEECCLCQEQRTAADSFRTLTTMVSAISTLFHSPPAEFSEFCFDELFSTINKAAKEREVAKKRTEQWPIKKGQKGASSNAFRMDKAATLFADSFVGLLRESEALDNSNSLDVSVQRFVVQICPQLNVILCPREEIEGGRNEKANLSSAESTPEDSNDEDGEVQEIRRGQPRESAVTEMELFEMVVQLLVTIDRDRQQQKGWLGEDIEAITAVSADESVHLAIRQRRNSPLMELISRNLHDSNCNRFTRIFQLNLSASDPLECLTSNDDSDKSVNNRKILFCWFRTELLHNCWSSFVRMFSQLKKQNSTEEAKRANIETLGTLVPLAIELGLTFELRWMYQFIAEQMCALENLREAVKRSRLKRSGDSDQQKAIRRFCGRIELTGMKVLLENAPGALRIAPKVSEHVVRCSQFLWELERWHFKMAKMTIDASIFESPSSQSGHRPIDTAIGTNVLRANDPTSTEIARFVDDFLALIDRIFSDCPAPLPLNSLCSLLGSLCTANENNLFYSDGLAPTESSAQLLQRLSQLVVGMSNDAMLISKIAVWKQIRGHLIQCASANSIPREVNRRAIDGVHEVVKVLLQREWGRHQQVTVSGWNSLLFSIFLPIISAESICVPETCLQVGQVILSFVDQSHEVIGSGWSPLFSTTQQLIRTAVDVRTENKESESRNAPLVALVLDIFEKFLAISKPAVLLAAFSEFVDALSLFLSLSMDDNSSTVFDQLFSLLERSEHILIDYLFNATIALPSAFVEVIDQKWDEQWQIMVEASKSEEEVNKDDYVHLLTDLGAFLSDQGMLEECPSTAEWVEGILKGGRKAEGLRDQIVTVNRPLAHLSLTPPPRAVVALHSFFLLQKLLNAILDKNGSFSGGTSNQSRLTLNFGCFLGELSAKIGVHFATFCLCAFLVTDIRRAVAFPLTASGVRCLKQLIGLLLPHQSVVQLLTLPSEDDEQSKHWRFTLQWHLLQLAVHCVAKGGTLSLVGCALIRNLCALSKGCPTFSALCAGAIWQSTQYALFPVRMLISQFFIHSTDFSSDLGKMRVSYRLGLSPSEVEERVDNVHQLANQLFQLEEQRKRKHLQGEGEGRREQSENGATFGGAHLPSKFAYLFIFENGANESGESGESQKLSMGVEELVDSLLCQQLLVQLVSEQLDSMDPFPSVPSVHGPLLASLSATLAICEQFELRPGLKSLIQKLTGLSRSANLWQLSLATMQTLLRWHFRQAFSKGPEGNEWEMRHRRRMEFLLKRMICGKRGKEAQGGNVRQLRCKEPPGGKGGGRGAVQERSNPFISSQMSIDSNKSLLSTMAASRSLSVQEFEDEEIKTRSLVLSRLLDRFCSDGLSLLNNKREAIGIMKGMLAEMERQMDQFPEEKKENDERKLFRRIIERLEGEEGKLQPIES